MSWNKLTIKEQNRIAYEFLQCGGYDDRGNEYESLEDYYNGVYRVISQDESEQSIIACEQGKITGAN